MYHFQKINLSQLSIFQRILLITDGTLTKILETYVHEDLQVVKLSEEKQVTSQNNPLLELTVGQEIITRKIVLQGKSTKNNWLYAESILVLERLQEEFKEKLLHSKQPIGKLWLESRMETYKEIVLVDREQANDLASLFRIEREEYLLYRTYLVFSNNKPIILITEKFPESYFTQW